MYPLLQLPKMRPALAPKEIPSPKGLSCLTASRTVTEWPCKWASIAAVRPPKPAPTIMTLMHVLDFVVVSIGLGPERVLTSTSTDILNAGLIHVLFVRCR